MHPENSIVSNPMPLESRSPKDLYGDRELEKYLFAPLRQLGERPSKLFRKRLVHLGYDLVQTNQSSSHPPQLDQAGDLLETLHLGSLIIDDIQDGSLERRGAPALHRLMGMPRALCAGNYLYFKALNGLRTLGLSPDDERAALCAYGETMENAHLGQMLDLSVKASTLEPEVLPALCEKVSLLKTGCLTAFALKLGALMGKASVVQLTQVSAFGLTYGVLLQYCDDLGNTTPCHNPTKRFEDLRQDKPTSLWSLVSRLDRIHVGDAFHLKSSASMFHGLRLLAHPKNYQEEALIRWLKETELLGKTRLLLQKDIKDIFSDLYAQNLLFQGALNNCQKMTEELLDAYTIPSR